MNLDSDSIYSDNSERDDDSADDSADDSNNNIMNDTTGVGKDDFGDRDGYDLLYPPDPEEKNISDNKTEKSSFTSVSGYPPNVLRLAKRIEDMFPNIYENSKLLATYLLKKQQNPDFPYPKEYKKILKHLEKMLFPKNTLPKNSPQKNRNNLKKS